MHAHRFLPPAVTAETGWPWSPPAAAASPPASETPWPKISIVTPNYNHAEYLEAAIRSVLLQGYPNLEYIVIDGGSTDGSVEIIKKYEPWLTHWESMPDRGQTHAINKGFARCTGEIVNWLCSDDMLAPNALHTVGNAFAEHARFDAILGNTHYRCAYCPARNRIDRARLDRLSLLPAHNPIWQPSCFYRRRLLRRNPPLDESLNYTMDHDLWADFMAQQICWGAVDSVLACATWHGSNKSTIGGDRILDEIEQIYGRYTRERVPLSWWHRRLRTPLEKSWMWLKPRPLAPLRYLLLGPELLYVLMLGPFYGFRRTALFQYRCLYEASAMSQDASILRPAGKSPWS